jgi:hypothetical protein
VEFTAIFLRLAIAHCIGDFVLQPSSWITERRARHWRSPRLYAHGVVHGALALVALGGAMRWREALVIAVAHVVVDVLKSYRDGHGRSARWFVLDQALHLAVIAVIAASLGGIQIGEFIQRHASNPASLAVVAAVLVVTRPASFLIATFTSRWDGELLGRKDNLSGAGKWIGLLERLLIVLFVVSDHFDAVGFLLAAKSVFRFGDLTNKDERKRTEYVLIGTLLSFAVAIAVGMLARAVLVAAPG